ncbi:MAG TPA: chorismate mutase, partial [Amaricoccus sp.]|nr:chorismate mutase [Amaricoccus sp.]
MTAEDIRRAADLLRGHRESIDRLDAILVFTLAERFKHTQAVGALKAQHGLGVLE